MTEAQNQAVANTQVEAQNQEVEKKFWEISPMVSAICTAAHFEEIKADPVQGLYQNYYLISNRGEVAHHAKLRRLEGQNRFIQLNVKDLPVAAPKEAKEWLANLRKERGFDIPDSWNYLVNGKVPVKFYYQIQNFFKEVCVVRKAMYEAMAHIVYRNGEGYKVVVPTQRVSAASVSYEFDHITSKDVIIVDIH